MIEFPTFPVTLFHPVHGAVVVDSPEKVALLLPATDWFHSAAEADAHRTENEAAIVIHNGRAAQVERHKESDMPGVVKHSVMHQETVDKAVEASAAELAAAGVEPLPPVSDETRGAELLG